MQRNRWWMGLCAGLLLSGIASAADDIVLRTRVEPVDVEILIPKEARPVQGILVHVFNYQLKTHDRNATLCRQLKWAHINTIISRKANNRPTKIRLAIEASLKHFAQQTGMPELVHVPRAGTGFSAGGMVTKVLQAEPDKMLTNAVSCSWVRDPVEMGEIAAVPHLFIIGGKPDGFKMLPAIEKFYEPAIGLQRPWALGLQHECQHDWANSGTLMMPWIAAIARMRYPEQIDVSKPIPLRPIRFEEGWRGDRSTINGTFAEVAPAAEFKGDLKNTTWLPDRATAYVWRAWQTKNSPVHLTAQAADGSKTLSAFNPRKSFGLSIAPGQDLTLGIELKKKLALTSVEYFHGDTSIGRATAAPWTVHWEGQPVGCYAVWVQYAVNGQPAVTNPAMICFEPIE